MQLALFIIFGALAVAGALNLLLQRHPINSALSLVVVMMSLAVLYWSLGAEFLAAAQVIVYSGAIMVLFVFVIMLLNAGEEERTHGSRAAYIVGIPRRRGDLLPAQLRLSLRAQRPRLPPTSAAISTSVTNNIAEISPSSSPSCCFPSRSPPSSSWSPSSAPSCSRGRSSSHVRTGSYRRTTSSSPPSSSPSASPPSSSSATSSPSSCRLS